jgi:1-deoxy-D-xylulose-5-phosphate synthase
MEDGIKHAGIASTISESLREAGSQCSVHSIGVPLEFIEHSKRKEILEDLKITPAAIVQQIAGWIS